MSIATEISRLQTAKAGLKTTIEAKGVTVSSAATLDAYPALVAAISGGGGITGTDVTVASSTASMPNSAIALINAINGSAGHIYVMVAKTLANSAVGYLMRAMMVSVSAIDSSSITAKGGLIRNSQDGSSSASTAYGTGKGGIEAGDVYTVYELPDFV